MTELFFWGGDDSALKFNHQFAFNCTFKGANLQPTQTSVQTCMLNVATEGELGHMSQFHAQSITKLKDQRRPGIENSTFLNIRRPAAGHKVWTRICTGFKLSCLLVSLIIITLLFA